LNLQEKLVEDMKAAMKAREDGRLRLSVIRLVRAAIKNAEVDKGRALGDAEVIDVIAREVKQRRDAIEEYNRCGRPDAADQLMQEISILMEYLPEQMDEVEIRKLAALVISELGARGSGDLGRVMGALMPKVRGRCDGKLVNKIVKELLSEV